MRLFQQPDLEPVLIGSDAAQTMVGAVGLNTTGPDTNTDSTPGHRQFHIAERLCPRGRSIGDPVRTAALSGDRTGHTGTPVHR